MKPLTLALFVIFSSIGYAQQSLPSRPGGKFSGIVDMSDATLKLPQITQDPSGPCTKPYLLFENISNGRLFTCVGGYYTPAALPSGGDLLTAVGSTEARVVGLNGASLASMGTGVLTIKNGIVTSKPFDAPYGIPTLDNTNGLYVESGFYSNVRTVKESGPVNISGDSVILIDAGNDPITLTLPSPGDCPKRKFIFKRIDTNDTECRLVPGAGMIEKQAWISLGKTKFMTILSDGDQYWIMSEF